MGGGQSEVTDATQHILLESAWFAPGGIRRTARRHSLHSEASHRFERTVDPEMVLFAQDRAARLLVELAGATVLRGRVDACPKPYRPRSFDLTLSRIGERLGTPVAPETTRHILGSLGFGLQGSGETVHVDIPSWRSDVEGEADCAEEVARFQGFASIPATMPRGVTELLPGSPEREAISRARGALSAAGFDEVINYSFVDAAVLKALKPEVRPITLQNPIAGDMSAMCTTRLAGLIGNLKHSRNRQVEDVRLYEIGKTYLPRSGKAADGTR
jgi:phenylalanyl-tRNA synthetase beta chain